MNESHGAELRSLLVSRSWLILTVVMLSWILTIVVTGPRWTELSVSEQACIGASLVCFAVAGIEARRPAFLWLTVVGMLLLAATALVPSGSFVWTYPQIYLGYVGFILSLLLPRSAGLVTAIIVPTVAWMIILSAPPNAILEGGSVAGGSVQFLRMLSAQLLLWLAWNRLKEMARQVDDERGQVIQVMLDAHEQQVRSSAWRAVAARVHATMLNSINAVLEAGSLDSTQVRLLADQGRSAIARVASDRPPLIDPVPLRLPVNPGLVLLTSALGGAMLGGSIYAFFIPYPSSVIAALVILTSMVGAASALVPVIRWRRIDWRLAALLVLAPAAVPWLLASWSHPCDDIGPVSATASLAGFAIVCIGLWSGPAPFVLGLTIWLAGALRITQASPQECSTAPTVIVLNVAAFLPIVVIVLLAGARRYRRARELTESLGLQAEAELRAARAQVQADEELASSVRQAADVLDAIGDQGSMDADQRTTLRCLSSRMRVAVMIDTVAAAGFSRSAHDLVVELADRGIPVDVAVISDSGDPRPVPPDLLRTLVDMVAAMEPDEVRVQSIGSAGWDFLSVGISDGPAASGSQPDVRARTVDGTTLTVSRDEDSQGMTVITIERVAP